MQCHIWLSGAVGGFTADKSGATAIEYVLIAAGIGLAIVISVGLVGDGLDQLFDGLAVSLAG